MDNELKTVIRTAAAALVEQLRGKVGWRPGPEPGGGTWWYSSTGEPATDGVELDRGLCVHAVRTARRSLRRHLRGGSMSRRVTAQRIMEALKPALVIQPGEWTKLFFEKRTDHWTENERAVIERAQHGGAKRRIA